MQEKDFYKAVGVYYLENTDYDAVELKFTRTDRFPFSDLPAHQESALLNPWYYKIPDNGMGQKPLDIVLKRHPAPLVIVYYKPGATEIYEIAIRDFIHRKYTSKEKSLHINDARIIGKQIHL